MAILALRAAAGWSGAETARRFLLAPATIAAWMRRLDERGEAALVQTREPMNRFPKFVAEIVATLRAAVPTMGKVRIANVLARAGLEIAPTTVARFLAKPRHRPMPAAPHDRRAPALHAKPARVVAARYVHHIWHADLTVVPTTAGFWVPWLPFSLPIVWPFAWFVAVVLDHHSRAVMACAVFRKQPTAADICALLDRAILDSGRAPRHLITDRGVQFQGDYLDWCARRRVRPRFGAVGKKGSIAIVERFIRSLKEECLRKIAVPLERAAIRREIEAYVGWHNAFRAHSSLAAGAVPADRLARRRGLGVAIETRPLYPLRRKGKRRRRRRLRGTLRLVIEHHRGRPHLPIVTLREAA